jgi:hypothetical protein
MNPNEEIERGARAQRILADSIFVEAFESVEKAIHELWAQCPIRDLEGQQMLRLELKLLGDVRAFLESAIVDAKHVKAELEAKNRRVLSPAQWSGR